MPESTPLLISGGFILGAIIGSFLNVVIIRVPKILDFDWRCQCRELLGLESEEIPPPAGIVTSRSSCPNCNHAIRPWENIPILSFLLLKGRCASCKKRISYRYPIVEIATGILFAITILALGVGITGISALVLTAFLVVLAGIDFDHQLLPDNLTIPLMWGGILCSFWSIHTDLESSVLGAVFGYLLLWSIFHIFRLLTGKEGMGYGDFKLMAALGAWLGWQELPVLIFISSILGALAGVSLRLTGKLEKDKPMPFGPFIAMAGWIALIWGDQLIEFYLGTRPFG